ncbi:MAG: ABC transporter permease subunit [Planctomycetota bacterium]|jgi:ABC-type Fe3+ transport system permease subunit/DNA-binding beta-propeller fold protein YncE
MKPAPSIASCGLATASDTICWRPLLVISLAFWAVVILLPLLILFTQATGPVPQLEGRRIFASLLLSFALAAVISAVAVLLGYIPGRMLGTCRARRDLLLFLLLMPLLLPRYVLYYAWTLVLSPTTELGRYVAGRPELARLVGTFSSSAVLILWYWPLAALLIAQGWRNIDRQVWDCASLDADPLKVFKNITLPLLAHPLLLAFGVCFVLSLSDFTTFHLAGVQTIGTELAVIYQQTGSETDVLRAAWPVVIVAILAAIILGKSSGSWVSSAPPLGTAEFQSQRSRWAVLVVLIGVSLIMPLALLIFNVTDTRAFGQFITLHADELGWSLGVAAGASALAHLIAFAALSLERTGRAATSSGSSAPPRHLSCFLSFVVRTTIFLAMFVPASLVAVGLLKMLASWNVPSSLRQGWYVVSAGQAARFAGVALILFLLARRSRQTQLSEMASLDGASALAAWWHVHLPRTWPLLVGSFILILMLSVTELSATMVLLPAGLPNFAQRLLNQMHYARDQQVIASCLVLICLFLLLAAVVVLLLRAVRLYRQAALMILAVCILTLAGCDDKSYVTAGPEVVYTFGQTGRGHSEFIYPRAIDLSHDGSLFVVDKTGRIQRLTPKGKFLSVIDMPLTEAGFPTGLTVSQDGSLYVADTHYHRVVVFSPDGKLIDEFGKFGQEAGCFIYPTDIAFAPDGRIFVSEYGGNDRISVFNRQGEFLYCFGTPGADTGQLARPSALCVDPAREYLYVADACNHRIAIYSFDGKLLGYVGTAGRATGQLRYPYDLALLSDGTLVVCEYGNNRLQLFGPDGRSLAVYGSPGRRPGQLAYPWGVAVDARRRALVVDAGNNRIQVWQL